jgi:hypothetical protein
MAHLTRVKFTHDQEDQPPPHQARRANPFLYFADPFSRIPREIREKLLVFARYDVNGRYLLDERNVEAVKFFLKEFLGIPQKYPLHLFADDAGRALRATPAAEVLLEGYVTINQPGGAEELVFLELNLTSGQLLLDERETVRGDLAIRLEEIEAEISRTAPDHEVIRRAGARAHLPWFRGRTDDGILIVTRGFRSPRPFFAFYGTHTSMARVVVDHEKSMQLEFGMLLQGTIAGRRPTSMLIPDEGGAMVPSFEGKKVVQESFLLNGHGVGVPPRAPVKPQKKVGVRAKLV